MSTNKNEVDPLLRSGGVQVEPEELLEPEIDAQGEPTINARPTFVKSINGRLSRYGNRVLGSAKNFFVTLWHMLSNIGTAIAGSVIVLPLLIILRGLDVLLTTVFSLGKSAVLSLLRAIFDVLFIPIRALNELFQGFNKRVLYPLIKRIREDDTTALIALGVMIVVVSAVVFIATRFIH